MCVQIWVSRSLTSRFRLLILAVDDGGVGSREVELFMVAIVPSDEIGRFPVLMSHLENDAVTIRLTRPMPSNHDSVSNLCVHGASRYLLNTYCLYRRGHRCQRRKAQVLPAVGGLAIAGAVSVRADESMPIPSRSSQPCGHAASAHLVADTRRRAPDIVMARVTKCELTSDFPILSAWMQFARAVIHVI
jgi:hypothetical protein